MTEPGAAALAVGEVLCALAERARVTASWAGISAPGRDADRAAGLAAAHRALAALDDPAGAAGRTIRGHLDDGCPRWPTGTTGSIAHAGPVAVAIATLVPHGAALGVGVDVERAGALPALDAMAVLDPAEQATVRAHPAPDELATRLWSVKEAAFKAWNTALGGGLDGVDPAEIHADLDDDGTVSVHATGTLTARVAPVGPLSGWCAETAGYVVALVTSRAAARGAHHGVDGMASAATTNPSAANATR